MTQTATLGGEAAGGILTLTGILVVPGLDMDQASLLTLFLGAIDAFFLDAQDSVVALSPLHAAQDILAVDAQVALQHPAGSTSPIHLVLTDNDRGRYRHMDGSGAVPGIVPLLESIDCKQRLKTHDMYL